MNNLSGASGPGRVPTPVPAPDPMPAPPEPVTPDSPEPGEPTLPSYEDQPPVKPIANRTEWRLRARYTQRLS